MEERLSKMGIKLFRLAWLSSFDKHGCDLHTTTHQVTRGESETNLANRFLIKFAKTEILGNSILVNLVTGPSKKGWAPFTL